MKNDHFCYLHEKILSYLYFSIPPRAMQNIIKVTIFMIFFNLRISLTFKAQPSITLYTYMHDILIEVNVTIETNY